MHPWSRTAGRPREVPARSGLERVYVFSVAQTFQSDIPDCRIAGLSACFDSAFGPTKVYWSKSADRNVGDTADRNVCATKARDAKLGRAGCVAKGFAPSAAGRALCRDVSRSGEGAVSGCNPGDGAVSEITRADAPLFYDASAL